MEISLLGPPQASMAGRPIALGPRKQQLLLAVLALEVNAHMRIERLIELMWPIEPPPTAKGMIHTYVSNLRKLLISVGARNDGIWLDRQEAGYRFRCDPQRVDAHRFDLLVAAARQCTDDGDRLSALTEALSLWRGPALAGIADDDVRDRLCLRLEESRITAVEERIEATVRLRRYDGLLDELFLLTAQHPMRPRLAGALMRELHRAGRAAEALEFYRSLRERMRDELGLDPPASLRDLQLAVLRNDSALTVDRAPTAPRQLPASIRHFVGRDAELKELRRLASPAGEGMPAGSTICAIIGAAGIGKTTLAVHWGHHISDWFPDGQLYINLRSFDPGGVPVGPSAAVRILLDALDVSPQRVPADLDAQAALLRSRLAGKRMLLLLDNARDAEQIRPLLPGTEGCLVIVTSRHRLTALCAFDGASTVTLDLLSTTEARELLTVRLGADRAGREPAAVDEIIVRCGNLPLALVIAAARAAARPHLTLAAISAEMRESSTLDAFDTSDPGLDIRGVFSWSYAGITTAAARLFRLLGLHPGPDISLASAASLAGEPVTRTRRLLVELTRAHLIAEYPLDRYVFHDLLRLFASEQVHNMEGQAQRDTATHRLLDHYLHTAFTADRLIDPHRDPITLPVAQPGAVLGAFASERDAVEWFARERQVLLALIDHAANTGRDTYTYQLDWTLTHHLFRCGQWIEQAAVGRAAVTAAHRSGDPAAQARAHHHLARAHLQLGNHNLAHDELQDAIRLAGDADDLIGQGNAHHVLSWVLERKGGHLEAFAHATQALSLFDAAGHLMGRARALNTIAWFHAQQGNHEAAVTFCQSALALHEKLGIREGLAATWHSLGYAQHNLGRYEAALRCYHHALNLFTDLQSRYYEAATLDSLGDTHRALGNPDAATAAWRRALPKLEELNHPDAEQVRAKLNSYSNELG